MPAKLPVNSPIREYVYDILYHMTPTERFKLHGKYYNIGRTNSRTKHFCNTARLEELQHVLTLLGVEWYMVFSPKTFVGGTLKMLEDVVDEKSQLNTLRNIIKRKIFVTGSKQFALLLGTLTQSIYPGIYVKNLQLDKVGYHYRKWSNSIGSGATKEESEASTDSKYLAKIIFNSLVVCRGSEYLEQDLMILIFLYMQNHAFVEHSKIVEEHSEVIHPRKIAAPIRRLLNIKKIQKHPKKRAYTITTSGVLDINDIFEEVLKRNKKT